MRKPKPEVYGPIQPIWWREKFPVLDLHRSSLIGERWVGRKKKLDKPYCWTPARPFTFAGKQFVWGYPCIAFETLNFGFIIQRGPHGMTFARE